LPHDLTNNDEIEVIFLDSFMCLLNHKNFAIKAGVQVSAIAVFWIDDDTFIFFNDINNVEFNAELLGHPQCIIALNFIFTFLANGMHISFDVNA
jgi:hypothetical protein